MNACRFPIVRALMALCAATGVPFSLTAEEQWRLIGITGQQQDETPDGAGGFLYPDHTLYEVDLSDAGLTRLLQATWVPDSQAIVFCPADGLLYHSAGANSYRDDPTRTGNDQGGPPIAGVGFQDSQYLEAINLESGVAVAVYNANPCPNPDGALPCFGLDAPRPAWLLPVERRNATQTDPSFAIRGEDEYRAARGLAWSEAEGLFYLTDEEGIFRLTREGDSVFVARPAFPSDGSANAQRDCKAIVFVETAEGTRLYVGHRRGVGSNGLLMEIDPATGEVLGEVVLEYPEGGAAPVGQFGGLLGLAQHPATGVLYGVRRTDENFARELVTIDLASGETAVVGNLGLHVAGITFARNPAAERFEILAVTREGDDVTLEWSGGTPPFQVETSGSGAAGSWMNAGAPTAARAATVATGGPPAFLRVRGQ